MIDLSTKIHDKFTLEFKVGFNTEQANKPAKFRDYVMNTWIFVPNSLDINAAKYSKDDFYRDLKSGVRLITPAYELHELANNNELLPSKALTTNFDDLHAAPDDTLDLTHTIKMYCAIAKSAFRDACFSALQQSDAATRKDACLQFLEDGHKVLERFRTIPWPVQPTERGKCHRPNPTGLCLRRRILEQCVGKIHLSPSRCHSCQPSRGISTNRNPFQRNTDR